MLIYVGFFNTLAVWDKPTLLFSNIYGPEELHDSGCHFMCICTRIIIYVINNKEKLYLFLSNYYCIQNVPQYFNFCNAYLNLSLVMQLGVYTALDEQFLAQICLRLSHYSPVTAHERAVLGAICPYTSTLDRFCFSFGPHYEKDMFWVSSCYINQPIHIILIY